MFVVVDVVVLLVGATFVLSDTSSNGPLRWARATKFSLLTKFSKNQFPISWVPQHLDFLILIIFNLLNLNSNSVASPHLDFQILLISLPLNSNYFPFPHLDFPI